MYIFHSAIVCSLLLVPYQRERKKVIGSTVHCTPHNSPILEHLEGIGCKVIYDAFSLIYEEGFGHI